MNGAPRGEIRILHVDDDEDFAETAATFLERGTDLTVITETSAPAALDRLATDEDRIDCVVSDYDMPEMEGLAFLERIRREYPALPFVLFTGNGSEAIAGEAISAGVTDYLQKESGTEQYDLLADRIRNAVSAYHADQRAATTDRRLQVSTEAPNAVFWMVTPDWSEFLFINAACEDIWGRSRDELTEQPRDRLNRIHPEDRGRVKDGMEALSNGESAEFEYRVAPDGDRLRWVCTHGEPIYDDAGNLDRIAGFARDISKRKEREREFKQSRELIEALSTTFPDYAFVIDEAGEYLDVITGWQRSELFTPGELIGQTVHDILANDTADEIHDTIREAIETTDLQTVEYPLEKPDQTAWYEGNVMPLPDGYEGEPAVILAARDITKRRTQKQELQRQNERLKAFASIVSHDLQNPLNVAEGYLKLAREECDNEHLDDVAYAHDRMGSLIENLLTLAREGDRVSEMESVDLTATVDRCWQAVPTAGATLVTEIDSTIRADQDRLRQLLENLLGNAVEHGSDDVTITVGELDDEAGFYIGDDGAGIPVDEREQVFENGYSATADGTGYGLSIVEEIAEAHNWGIRLTESEDGGARFEITDVQSTDRYSASTA